MFRAIEARREIPLERFLYALGMRHVGETRARVLARAYGSWDAFLQTCERLVAGHADVRDELEAIDRIGTTRTDGRAPAFREGPTRPLAPAGTGDRAHLRSR